MCSARGVIGACALALALLHTLPAHGQQLPAIDRAALRARIDSLEIEYAAAETAAAIARRARTVGQPTEPLDTQRVGPLTIISKPGSSRAAREATESALARFGPIARTATDPLASAVLLIEIGGETAGFDSMRLLRHHSRVWMPGYRPASWRTDVVSRDIGARLGTVLPERVREWLDRQSLRMNRADDLRAAYRLLAVNPSPAARDCFAGVIARCADALGLTDPGADYERWYTERQLVTWLLGNTRQRSAEREACAAARTMSACRPYLAMQQQQQPPPPLDVNARRTLLAHALEAGGADAWLRLTGDTSASTLEQQLARVAGMSSDALLRSWHDAVMDARPAHTAGFAASWLVTLAWAALVAALAMRSTRWRLG